ncbi:MAG: hypothetical protein M3Q68_06855 [Actinomycetota bacterium]|nr:hypothetical protein [Actinomycetota bacterium]
MSDSTVVPFRVTTGPYAGDYEVDVDDLTASEVRRFRDATGQALQRALTEGIDVDTFAGLVWLVRSRSGANRGLAFQAVADAITRRSVEPLDEKVEGDPLDPTSSGGD